MSELSYKETLKAIESFKKEYIGQDSCLLWDLCVNDQLEDRPSYDGLQSELERAHEENEKLKKAIEDHNVDCDLMCENNSSCNKKNGYPSVKCVECAREWRIEL